MPEIIHAVELKPGRSIIKEELARVVLTGGHSWIMVWPSD